MGRIQPFPPRHESHPQGYVVLLKGQGLCKLCTPGPERATEYSLGHDWDLRPAQTHGTWFQDLMKLRFLMSYCKKN